MTDREKAIVMAYTGICMLEGEKIGVFYKYLHELYGRPVYTHEWVTLDIKEKSKPDFLQLCKEEEPERKTGRWIYGEDEYGIDGYHCDKCGFFVPWDYTHKFINYIEDYKFCPNCGLPMIGGDGDALD